MQRIWRQVQLLLQVLPTNKWSLPAGGSTSRAYPHYETSPTHATFPLAIFTSPSSLVMYKQAKVL
jgi:hypothetical protein